MNTNSNGNINNSIFLQYKLSDFEYYPYNSHLSDCDVNGINNIHSCDNITDMDSTGNQCTIVELCKNRHKALQIQQMQNKHSGEDERYENMKQLYNSYYLNMINLGIGTLFGLLYIINNYKSL